MAEPDPLPDTLPPPPASADDVLKKLAEGIGKAAAGQVITRPAPPTVPGALAGPSSPGAPASS